MLKRTLGCINKYKKYLIIMFVILNLLGLIFIIKFGNNEPHYNFPNTVIFTPKPLRPPKIYNKLTYIPIKIKSFVDRPHFHKKYTDQEVDIPKKPKETEEPCYVEKPMPNYEDLQKQIYDNNGKLNLPLIWMAPFKSGGGYCSEAISFVEYLMLEMNNLRIIHWGNKKKKNCF